MNKRNMKGRRIPTGLPEGQRKVGSFPALEMPGDYCGPMYGYTGDKPAVFFLKPNARDHNAPPRAKSVQHVIMPPHRFVENNDGTLTIEGSIGDTAHGTESDGWHGFLSAGNWHEA
jgi:hypothetical protein